MPGAPTIEDVAVPAVEIGVEADDDPVVLVDPASPVQDVAADTVGFRIEEHEAEVEGVLVVGDPHLGALAGGRAVHRVALAEPGHRRDVRPEGLVENAVDARWGLDPDPPAPPGPGPARGIPQGSRRAAGLPPRPRG